MNVPDKVRKCVVFLGYVSPADGEVLAGTGFYLALKEGGRTFLYLVTAAHVVEGMRERAVKEFHVRVNKKDGGVDRITCEPGEWFFHPAGPVVDVAVVPWPFWLEQEFGVYPAEAAATPEVLAREGIGLGDEVFMVGLYTKHAGKGRNIPIVRVGNLAAVPEEPVVTGRCLMDGYLVEIRSIGGISGSPVFVRPMPGVALGGEGELMLRSPYYLFGLMHGRWDMRHLAQIMFEIDADFHRQPLNSGIGVVVPVGKILGTLHQPALTARRAKPSKARRRRLRTPRTPPDDLVRLRHRPGRRPYGESRGMSFWGTTWATGRIVGRNGSIGLTGVARSRQRWALVVGNGLVRLSPGAGGRSGARRPSRTRTYCSNVRCCMR